MEWTNQPLSQTSKPRNMKAHKLENPADGGTGEAIQCHVWKTIEEAKLGRGDGRRGEHSESRTRGTLLLPFQHSPSKAQLYTGS